MSNPIRAIVVDDEELGRINLRYALADHPHWQIQAECANVAGAREVLHAQTIDVIFLDVQMPRESGLVLAKEIAQLSEPPLIIFVTAFNEHAIAAFELHALDYLLKPLHDQRLSMALERAEQMLALRQQANYGKALRAYIQDENTANTSTNTPAQASYYWQQVSVRSIGRIECIQLADVHWIEAQGNYMLLHCANRQVLHRVAMSQLEKHLDPSDFIRVHRSSIVNTKQIAAMLNNVDNTYQLHLRCGDLVTVSERYYAKIKALMDTH
jgi:two-component system LytT family response regulator